MSKYRRLLPYGVAIGSTAIAVLLSLWLKPFLSRTLGGFFYIAVILSSWYGGFRPGMVAITLSMLAIDYFFLPHFYQFWIDRLENVFPLGIFLLVSLVINLLTTNLKDSKKKIAHLNQQLLQENAEQLGMAGDGYYPAHSAIAQYNRDSPNNGGGSTAVSSGRSHAHLTVRS